MSEPHISAEGEGTNLGAGNEEPDPATAANSPDEIKAGDEKREREGGPDTEAEAGVGGLD
jgi:hypothetical protein